MIGFAEYESSGGQNIGQLADRNSDCPNTKQENQKKRIDHL
jgi:hypothetical protein